MLRKIVRISRANRITSIADFIASRYGKSAVLAGIVTVIAVVGIVPYIALQLKAVSGSFPLLARARGRRSRGQRRGRSRSSSDTAFYVALLLAVFAILFGARHLDAAERHEGMVAAIAFESVVKLVAFLAIGAVRDVRACTPASAISSAAPRPIPASRALLAPLDGPGRRLRELGLADRALGVRDPAACPRQFQVAVVENVDESPHRDRRAGLFPLYMLAINLFVLPIAFGGLLHFPGRRRWTPTLSSWRCRSPKDSRCSRCSVFLGGLSAATGMVIVETVALSTMVCNDLVMPLAAADWALLRPRERRTSRGCCSASGAARSSASCCSATPTSGSPARRMRWSRSA